jgi:hypothetical protein
MDLLASSTCAIVHTKLKICAGRRSGTGLGRYTEALRIITGEPFFQSEWVSVEGSIRLFYYSLRQFYDIFCPHYYRVLNRTFIFFLSPLGKFRTTPKKSAAAVFHSEQLEQGRGKGVQFKNYENDFKDKVWGGVSIQRKELHEKIRKVQCRWPSREFFTSKIYTEQKWLLVKMTVFGLELTLPFLRGPKLVESRTMVNFLGLNIKTPFISQFS